AFARRAGHLDKPSMGLDNAVGQGKAEAGAFRTSREEGLEDARKGVGRNAAPGVRNRDGDVVVILEHCESNLASGGNRLDAIESDVEEDLLDKSGVVFDRRQGGIGLKENLNRLCQDLLASEQDGLFDSGIDVGRVEGGGAGPGVGQQVVQDGLNVENFA